MRVLFCTSGLHRAPTGLSSAYRVRLRLLESCFVPPCCAAGSVHPLLQLFCANVPDHPVHPPHADHGCHTPSEHAELAVRVRVCVSERHTAPIGSDCAYSLRLCVSVRPLLSPCTTEGFVQPLTHFSCTLSVAFELPTAVHAPQAGQSLYFPFSQRLVRERVCFCGRHVLPRGLADAYRMRDSDADRDSPCRREGDTHPC